MVFHDDASRIRTKHATANFTLVRRYVTTLLKRDTCKRSLKQKRKKRAGTRNSSKSSCFQPPFDAMAVATPPRSGIVQLGHL